MEAESKERPLRFSDLKRLRTELSSRSEIHSAIEEAEAAVVRIKAKVYSSSRAEPSGQA